MDNAAGNKGNRKRMLRDILLVVVLLALAVVLLIVIYNRGREGSYVVVMIRNKEIARYSLAINAIYAIYDIYDDYDNYDNNGDNGRKNKIEIKDGRVRMLEASCPNHLCIRQGWISLEGQSIVCLPNKVVVRIEGSGNGPDFVQ